jgi:hypothetical protein
MQNLRKFENGKFAGPQMQRGRGCGVPTSVAREPRFTTGLPKGTAQRFLEFADEAAKNDLPLNTLLTLRWHALRAEGADYPYMSLPPRDRIARTVELLRKFTTNRGCKFPWIWVQENPPSQHGGLHWHLGFHSKLEWRGNLTDYVESHFGLPRLPRFLVRSVTEGEIARSEAQAWHLATDTHPHRLGHNLALYLGKGDSSCEELSKAARTSSKFRPQGKVDGMNKDRFSVSRVELR